MRINFNNGSGLLIGMIHTLSTCGIYINVKHYMHKIIFLFQKPSCAGGKPGRPAGRKHCRANDYGHLATCMECVLKEPWNPHDRSSTGPWSKIASAVGRQNSLKVRKLLSTMWLENRGNIRNLYVSKRFLSTHFNSIRTPVPVAFMWRWYHIS